MAPKASPDTGNPPIPPDSTVRVTLSSIPFLRAWRETISGMPIATSTYWNQVHGANAEEAALDEEGMQCMRELGRNMVFLMKSISLGKSEYGLPEREKRLRTNFIRK